MIRSLVVDASTAVSWVHPGQQSDFADRLLQGVGSEHRLEVPSLWPLEVANALLTLERRGRMSAAQRVDGVSRLVSMPVEVDHLTMAATWSRLLPLAVAHQLSVYDASYLELALRQTAALATRHEALRSAARASGVQLWE